LLRAAALTSFKGLTETLVRELARHLKAPGAWVDFCLASCA
jgi:hypothetical protein